MTSPRRFAQVAVIDWSGEAVARPKGIAVACADADSPPAPILQKGWTREAVLDWLRAHGSARSDLLIGLDLSPAFPFVDAGAYFPGLPDSPPDAKTLWAIIDARCAGDAHLSARRFLDHDEVARHFRMQRDGLVVTGNRFGSGRGRLRVCERVQFGLRLSPSSCFNLVGAAQVGKSSLTGMRVLHRLAGMIPVWPFDPVPATGPMIVEIYTSLAAREAGLRAGLSKMRDGDALDRALMSLGCAAHTRLARYDDHVTDALLTAAWLRDAARRPALWNLAGLPTEVIATEGWTFGVPCTMEGVGPA